MWWHFFYVFCCFTRHESEFGWGQYSHRARLKTLIKIFSFPLHVLIFAFVWTSSYWSLKRSRKTVHRSALVFTMSDFLLSFSAFPYSSLSSISFVTSFRFTNFISLHFFLPFLFSHYPSHTFPKLQCNLTVTQTANCWFLEYYCPEARPLLTSDHT